MRTFSSLGQFGNFLQRQSIRAIKKNCGDFMVETAKEIKKDARDSVGQYRSNPSPYQKWDRLKDSTVERKIRGGYSRPEDPLYRSGRFQRYIGYAVQRGLKMTATIGTNDEYIAYTELGTKWMPPRPVFGPAALRVLPRRLPRLRSSVVGGMLGLTGMAAQTYAAGRGQIHIVR